MATLKTQIKLRRGTYSQLQNVILAQGEPCFITDRNQLAVGNGTDAVKNLELFNAGEPEIASNYMTPEECGYIEGEGVYVNNFDVSLPNLQNGCYTIIKGLKLYLTESENYNYNSILRQRSHSNTPTIVNVMFTKTPIESDKDPLIIAIILLPKKIFMFYNSFSKNNLTVFGYKYYNGIPAPHVKLGSFGRGLPDKFQLNKKHDKLGISTSNTAIFSAPRSTTAKLFKLMDEGFIVNFIIEYLDDKRGWVHLIKKPLDVLINDSDSFDVEVDGYNITIQYDTKTYNSIRFKIQSGELWRLGYGDDTYTNFNCPSAIEEAYRIYPINKIRFIGSHTTICSLGESGKISVYQGLSRYSYKRPYGKLRARISAKHTIKNIYISSLPSAELKVSCNDRCVRKGYVYDINNIQFTIE